jgi:hypothetical protein
VPEAIVDGSNIAYAELTPDGKPRVRNLLAARDTVERAGYDATIVVDPALKNEIDDPDSLEALVGRGLVRYSPKGTELDYFVLDQCEARGAIVVSNDDYADKRSRYPWIEYRRVPVTIVDGTAQLDEVALQRARADDIVTEASKESFPASDPPAYS